MSSCRTADLTSLRAPRFGGPLYACSIAAIMLLVFVEAGLQARLNAQTAAAGRHGRLFPPQDLGLLEGPDRDAWQKPDQIMDALAIADGSAVADIGAGAGWFTIRMARRVGPNGIVYAQDVQRQALDERMVQGLRVL